jgi:hypothetical protein
LEKFLALRKELISGHWKLAIWLSILEHTLKAVADELHLSLQDTRKLSCHLAWASFGTLSWNPSEGCLAPLASSSPWGSWRFERLWRVSDVPSGLDQDLKFGLTNGLKAVTFFHSYCL